MRKIDKSVVVYLLLLFGNIVVSAQDPSPTPTPAEDKVVVSIAKYTNGETLNLFESQELEAIIEAPTESPDTIELKCGDKNVCTTQRDSVDKRKWLITVANNSNNLTTNITVKRSAPLANHLPPSIADQRNGSIPVKVYKIVPPSEKIIIHIDENVSLGKLLALDPQLVTAALNVNRTSQAVIYEEDKIKGAMTGDGTLEITPKIGRFTPKESFSLPIDVIPAELTIKFLDKSQRYKGNVNDKIYLAAEVRDAQGNRLAKETNEIQWIVKNIDQDKINVRPQGDGKVEIDVLKESPSSILLEAKIKGKEIKDSINLFANAEPNVVGFNNIEMRLNMIDDRSATDLFGAQATADYMVAKLRIFNKIPMAQNGGPASSILFFSEALEVNVGLEKRVIDKKRDSEKSWQPITLEDVEFINNWVYNSTVDDVYIRYFFKRDLNCNALKEILRVNTCELDTSSLDRIQYFYERELCNRKENPADRDDCKTRLAQKNWTPFRPHAFLIVASTHERRSERSARERILRIANGVVSAASFATAFASTTNNTGYTFAFDKYSNLLVPAFEKLFPSRREVQRKNILDMALQPYEEVSFGREVSKMVFIPRKSIPGILPNYDVRIVTVSVSKLKAEVSVVQKQKVGNP